MARPAATRLLVAGAVVPLLVLTGLLPASADPGTAGWTATSLGAPERISSAKAPSSRLAQTDPELLARTDDAPVQVLIKLDQDSSAVYTGGVAGLAPTSPSVTGEQLTGSTPAEEAYDAYQATQEAAVVDDLEAAVPSIEVGESLRTVYGGIAATIPASQVEAVLAVDGVTAVQQDELHQLLTDSSATFLNAPPVYSALGGTANAGAGVIYGNLDSGVWPEHPSFADQGNLAAPPGPARVCDYGDNPLTPEADPFVCNNKLIGGQPFLDAYLANPVLAAAEPFSSARDSNGHGTHTASTSAGNIVDDVTVLGAAQAPIHGMAPGAWVMEYKVCGISGCFGSDSAAAVGQAILDGVDVINFSISGGSSPFTDPVELAFLDAYAAGVFVAASAGNSGPGASTADHLSPWVTTVAASTQQRAFTSTLTLTSAGGNATFEGASITPGAGPAPLVLASAAPYGDALCQTPAPAGLFAGQIVACERGGNARVDKGFNVAQGGALGMVLYNPALADVETDTHWLPAVHLADGTDFLAYVASHTAITAAFTPGAPSEGEGDVMAAFSSRGPAGLFVKPDVTAPGVEILAGDTPIAEGSESGPPGEYFQAIAGTSMSSPHVAGAAILGRAVHPTWTPGQLKSALMTTAVTDVVKEDLVTPADPFDMGAGRIDIGRSAGVSLTLDETAAQFLALGGDPVTAVNLNLPSINAPVMPGRLTTTRTFTNPTNRTVVVRTSSQAPAGSSISVSPRSAAVAPGRSLTVTVTITSSSPLGTQQFGTVFVTPTARGAQPLHLPVAFVPTQGSVTLTQACAPETISIFRHQTSTCSVSATNTAAVDQVVSLDSRADLHLRVTGATGASVTGNRRVQLSNVTLAGSSPGVPSVGPGPTPAGYLPLDLFGTAPVPIGDEDLLNFDVPTFVYNGVPSSRIGIDSNGYLVVGGGTSTDNSCCDLPTGADPAPPNNVIAPFWTDLDGTGAPGILLTQLTDGVNSWVVVEWRVNVFGTNDLRTFQVWLGNNGTQDVSMVYPPDALPTEPVGQAFLVGAENEVGAGDMEAVLPTEDLVVTSTDPTPGDTAAYSFTVTGAFPGHGSVRTEMTASAVPGVTVVSSNVRVRLR